MKVLVSNPSFGNDAIWLPYLWGRVKLSCSLDVDWLDPIFFSDSAEVLTKPYDSVDVLLLSCYVWNWEKNIEIAKIIKEKNSDCYIIAGGPQATHTEHFEICDVIWTGEIENVIDDLLLKRNVSNRSRVDLSAFNSPYAMYIEQYKEFANQIIEKTGKKPAAIWETNRGCPYKCTFCDWGSLTNSKIRRFSHNTVLKDIEAISEIGVGFIFNADANFGIFKEDLEYAKHLAKMNMKNDSPKSVFFSSAKNKKDITAKASKVLYDQNMIPSIQISYQHTDADVLSAIKRDNISTQKLKDELEDGFRQGIPLVGVVIMGNPEDTVDKWISGIDDLLDIGFHEDIRYHDFMILPNAPAANPAYIKQYGIKTIWRNYYSSTMYNASTPPPKFKAEFISATKTLDEDGMVQIQSYTSFVVGMHNLNVTRYIAMLLKYYYGVPYSTFYKSLIENPNLGLIYDMLSDHMTDYIAGNTMDKSIEFNGAMIPPDLYVKTMALINIDAITRELIEVIIDLTGMTLEQASDLVLTQKRTIVGWWGQPDIKAEYNFIDAFRNLNGLPPNTNPKDWELKKEERIISSNQSYVGEQVRASIDKIHDFDSWFYSDIHKKENIRNKMNHYMEIFNE